MQEGSLSNHTNFSEISKESVYISKDFFAYSCIQYLRFGRPRGLTQRLNWLLKQKAMAHNFTC